MPAIRDWTFNYGTSTTATTIGATLPQYQSNDLLIAMLSADTGSQQWMSLDPVGYYYQYTATGATYTDETTAANNATTGDIQITGSTAAVNDAGYWGSDNIFAGIAFNCSTAPSVSQTWVHEYWNGSAWATLTTSFTGITTTMATGIRMTSFTPPGSWAKTTVNGTNAYWVRVRVSAFTSQTTRPLGTQAYISNYMPLFSVTNTNNLAVMYKIAGSEVNPTFSYSIAETANVHLISIRDVNTTTPFNGTGGAGTGYITANNSAAVASLPQLTTTVNNSLILYLTSESGTVVSGILQGPCTFEYATDGSAHSDGFSWGFLSTAGATSTTVKSNKNGTAAGVNATIGISPPSGGATVIPTYCARDDGYYIDPIHGTTAYNSNTAFAATATTNFGSTLNGATLVNGTAAAATDVGINSFHSMGQVTGVTTAGQWAGATLVLAAGNKPNVSGKNILCHAKPSTPKVYQNTDPISGAAVKGLAFGISSLANTDYRWWHVGGTGILWNSAQHFPIVINDGNTTARIQNTGSLNAASIAIFGFATSGFTVAPIWQFGSLWVLDTTVIAGGNSTEPVGITGINKVCALGKERMSVIQQGASQILVLQPIQFGDGGTSPIYLKLDASAIEFPQQYNTSSRQVFYCSVDNVAGITYYPGASDTIIHTNSLVSSASRYKWGLHPSASTSASYNFSGTTVKGAGTITLNKAITITSLTINDYVTLDASNAAFVSSSIKTVPSSNDSITVNGSTSFTGCNIDVSTVTAGNYWVSTASPSIFTNCTFTGGGGHAIRITSPGIYNFSGNIFNSFGSTGTTSAAIYNDSGGAVTLNILSGGSTPTYRNGTGASTTVNNNVTVTVKILDVLGVAIQNARVAVYRTSDSLELGNALTNASGIMTFSYNYSSDTAVDIRTRKNSPGTTRYINNDSFGTITSSGLSVTITMIVDTIVDSVD